MFGGPRLVRPPVAAPPPVGAPRIAVPQAPTGPAIAGRYAPFVAPAPVGYVPAGVPAPTSVMEYLMMKDAGLIKPAHPQAATPKGFGEALDSLIGQAETGTQALERLVKFAQGMGGDPTWEKIVNGPIGQNLAAGLGQVITVIPQYYLHGKLIDKVSGLVKQMKEAGIPPAAAAALLAQVSAIQQQGATIPMQAVPGADPATYVTQGIAAPNPSPVPQAFDLTPEAKQQIANLEAQVAALVGTVQEQQKQTAQVAQQLNQTAAILARMQPPAFAPQAPPAMTRPATTPAPPASVAPSASPMAAPGSAVVARTEYQIVCGVCQQPQRAFGRSVDEAVQNLVTYHLAQFHPQEFTALQQQATDFQLAAQRGEVSQVDALAQVNALMSRIVAGAPVAVQKPVRQVAPPPKPAPHPVPPIEPEPDDTDDDDGSASSGDEGVAIQANGGVPRATPPRGASPPRTQRVGTPPSPTVKKRGRPRKSKVVKPAASESED